jgi:hypothetical protein
MDDFDGESIEDLFERRLLADAPKKKPSENETGEQENEAPEDEDAKDETSDESPEDEDEADESDEDTKDDESEDDDEEADKPKKTTTIDSDDAVVKVKVGEEEHEVPVKDLKRLWGQEAALTRKSQEAAEVKRQAEQTGTKYVAGLEGLLTRAREAAKPYEQINFLALSKDPSVTAEELTALMAQAQSAHENVKYLESELNGVVQHVEQARQTNLKAQATECLKVLTDPKTGIEGWNGQMYNDLRSFAVNSGLPGNLVNELVDPVVFKLLHKAWLFDKGQKATTKTTKIDKTPKKIMKGTVENQIIKRAPKQEKAFAKLQRTGDIEDAENAFLARLK